MLAFNPDVHRNNVAIDNRDAVAHLYRHRYRVTPEAFDELVDDLRTGKLDAQVPPHGTLGRNPQHIPADRAVGARHPDDVAEGPAWIEVSPA